MPYVHCLPDSEAKDVRIRDCKEIRLKNRRIILGYSNDAEYEWFVQFKRLADKKKRTVYVSNMLLSDEALRALVELYRDESGESEKDIALEEFVSYMRKNFGL